MDLESDDGVTLRLEVEGYQFLHPQQRSDLNWLDIRITVASGNKQWSAVSPCLLTSELQELADWLEALASGRKPPDRPRFMEQNLEIETVEDLQPMRIRIRFEPDGPDTNPPWATELLRNGLEFAASPDSLRSAADALRRQLKRFPHRRT